MIKKILKEETTVNSKPISLSRRALPAFLKYLPHLKGKKLRQMTSPAGPNENAATVMVPVNLEDHGGLTGTKTGGGAASTDDGLVERHPGWWFKDIFSDLDKEEKVAWLELLTLALAAHPQGLVTFCSVRQLAAWLGVSGTSLGAVLGKALRRWMIEIHEVVLVPVSDESVRLRRVMKADLPPSALGLLEGDNKGVARFYSMIFPGFYADNRGPMEQKLSVIWERESGYSQFDKDVLDRQLEEPYRLLEKRLAKGKRNKYETRIETESPWGTLSTIRLPWPPLYHIGSADEVERSLSGERFPLLPISQSDVPKAVFRLWLARFNMMSLFCKHLKKDIPAAIIPEK